LAQEAQIVSEVCVVDNASTDGSAPALENGSFWQGGDEFRSGSLPSLKVLSLPKNLGFGPANNLGVEATKSPFIALVNSDAFVFPGALQTMRDYLVGHPQVGVVGPRLLNADGTVQESRFAFPTPWRAWFENLGGARILDWLGVEGGDGHGNFDWLSGACLMLRREAWVQADGFDESFFLYSEETDLQKRIRSNKWEVHWVPEAVVTHLGGSSGLGVRQTVRECFFEGVDRYFLKHHGWFGAASLRAATATGAALRWTCELLHDTRRAQEAAWIFKRQVSRKFPRR